MWTPHILKTHKYWQMPELGERSKEGIADGRRLLLMKIILAWYDDHTAVRMSWDVAHTEMVQTVTFLLHVCHY